MPAGGSWPRTESRRPTPSPSRMYSYRILKGLTRKIARIPASLLPVIATARARGRVKLSASTRLPCP
jgi:hypothetical protein